MRGRRLRASDRAAIIRALRDPSNTYGDIAAKFSIAVVTVRGIGSANGFTAIGRGRA